LEGNRKEKSLILLAANGRKECPLVRGIARDFGKYDIIEAYEEDQELVLQSAKEGYAR
jgi:hypothetical protein